MEGEKRKTENGGKEMKKKQRKERMEGWGEGNDNGERNREEREGKWKEEEGGKWRKMGGGREKA